MLNEKNMFRGEKEPQLEPSNIDPEIGRAFDEIIHELRQRRQVHQPTKLERVLEEFRRAGKEGVDFEQITPLYENNVDPEKATGIAIVKLNKKLEPKGIRLKKLKKFTAEKITKK